MRVKQPHKGRIVPQPLRALVLDADAEAAIEALKAKAAECVISLDIIEQRARAWREGNERPRDWLEFRITVPEDFVITFTIEQHPPCRLRHLEVMIDEMGKLPPREVCELLMKRFGFINDFDGVLKWPDHKPGRYHRISIHMAEPEDGDFDTYIAAMKTVENSPLVSQ